MYIVVNFGHVSHTHQYIRSYCTQVNLQWSCCSAVLGVAPLTLLHQHLDVLHMYIRHMYLVGTGQRGHYALPCLSLSAPSQSQWPLLWD